MPNEDEYKKDAEALYDRLAELFDLVGEWSYETKDLKWEMTVYVAELERLLNIVSSFATRAYLHDDYTTPIN